jgi:hypothetical protein
MANAETDPTIVCVSKEALISDESVYLLAPVTTTIGPESIDVSNLL